MCTKVLELAIKKAGNQTALAKIMGVKPVTISAWLHRNKKVPVEHVPKLAAFIDKPCWQIRSDKPHLFPKS